jgi:hypothetical protein
MPAHGDFTIPQAYTWVMGAIGLVLGLFTVGYILGVWTGGLVFRQRQGRYEDAIPAAIVLRKQSRMAGRQQ